MMHVRPAGMSAVVASLSLLSLVGAPSASAQFVFAPGTPQAEVDRFNQAWMAENGPIDRYVTTTRWPGTLGEGARVTVSFVPDGVSIPAPAGVGGGAAASSLFSTLDSQFLNLGGRNRWRGAVAQIESTIDANNPIVGGGANIWQNVTNLQLRLQGRTLGLNPSDDPLINIWDDGAAWGQPGPLHPPTGPGEALTIAFTANPPTLVSALVTVNNNRTQLSIVRTPSAGQPALGFSLVDPATDTIGELAAAISLNAGFSASVGAGVSPTTPSVVLAGNQSATLTAGAPNLAFQTQGALIPERGDIRIAMRPLPSSILAAVTAPAADGGDIILNSTLQWTLGTNARVLQATIARAVGEALGLAQVCPNDKTKLMEPVLNLSFPGSTPRPFIDDIRGIQRLYGDILDLTAARFATTGTRTKVFEPNDDPTVPSDNLAGPWPLGGIPVVSDEVYEVGLSLDDVTDRDFFEFAIGNQGSSLNVSLKITVTPVGGTYNVGAVDTACAGTPINATSVYNVRANIFTALPLAPATTPVGGIALGDGSVASPTPFSSFIDTAGVGLPEVVTYRIVTGGRYVIGVSATGTAGNQSQLYNLKLEFVNLNFVAGVPFGPIAADCDYVLGLQPAGPDEPQPRLDGWNGHGALTYRRDPESNQAHFYNTNYLGSRATYATLEGTIPTVNHDAFAGRSLGIVEWTGVNPAVLIVDNHPTQTQGAGAGATVPLGTSFFRGVAPEANLVTGSVASAIDPFFGFYTVSLEAVYHSLFTMSDPVLSVAAGLAGPVTVINSSWGGSGDLRGDSATALAYDATVSTYGTTIVVAAGNDGEFDNTEDCGPGGGGVGEVDLLPGGAFVGARTIGTPASAFNVLSVGAVGKGGYQQEFPPPTEDDGGGAGGGGGGGGGARGAAGGGGGGTFDPSADPATVALNTVVNFSSKGAADTFVYNPTAAETLQFNARPGIHIVAAGTGFIARAIDPALFEDNADECSLYGEGHVPIRGIGLPIPDPELTNVFQETEGTSFSAPTVAGAVALLQDFGKAQVPPQNIDSLVMRSVLMTSATKMPGWSNNGNPAKPQDDFRGRQWEFPEEIISTQITGNARGLDLAQGAGLLSIPYAFSIYALGDLRDSPATDPNIPSQTQADEIPLPEFPGTGGRPAPGSPSQADGRAATRSMPGIWSTQEKLDLQNMLIPERAYTAAEANRVLEDMRAINDTIVYRPFRPDTTDPDIRPGGGGKSGAGVTDDREPFLPGGRVPGSQTGDGPAPVKPVVIPSPIPGGQIGWDIGNIGIKPLRLASGARVGGFMDYQIFIPFARYPRQPNPPPLVPDPNFPPPPFTWESPTYLTATLVWNRTVSVKKPNFANLDNPQVGLLTELELENLDLELYQTATGEVFDGQEPVAFSRTTFNNIEHLHVPLAAPGLYILRVTWTGRDYNFYRNLPRASVKYGLSWAWSHELNDRVAAPNTLPAPPVTPPAAGLPLLNEVLFRFGAEIDTPSYVGLADINRDGVINTKDLIWVLSRLNSQPGV